MAMSTSRVQETQAAVKCTVYYFGHDSVVFNRVQIFIIGQLLSKLRQEAAMGRKVNGGLRNLDQ